MRAAPSSFPLFKPPVGRVARGPVRTLGTLAPRVAPAAVRIPLPAHVQLPLPFPPSGPQIFVHEGARQKLERRLRTAFAGPVMLAVTDNRHSMITRARRGGVLRARVHMMFLDAPTRIQQALVDYLVKGSATASRLVGTYIDANGHRIRATRPVLTPLTTKGEHHDLLAIYADVNSKYFGGTVDALVTWGRRTPQKPRATIKLGSYSAVERLIRVHPNLDRKWVPRYFLQFIVYHEMLHHVIPTSRGAARALLHPPEFRERERQFKHYERSVAWEKSRIARLLRL